VIGNVDAVAAHEPGGPLVYFDRTFHTLGEPIE
jgi:hypothetical protein